MATLSYDDIIDLSELVRGVEDASFRIKLRSMNSLIALSRNSAHHTGFSVVSKDLMSFSDDINHRSDSLYLHLQSILQSVTSEKKALRRISLLERSGSADSYLGSLLEKSKENQDKLVRMIRETLRQIEDTLKLCRMGNMIVVSSKIEAVYMGSDALAYHKLAEDVGQLIQKIVDSFQDIKRRLS